MFTPSLRQTGGAQSEERYSRDTAPGRVRNTFIKITFIRSECTPDYLYPICYAYSPCMFCMAALHII